MFFGSGHVQNPPPPPNNRCGEKIVILISPAALLQLVKPRTNP